MRTHVLAAVFAALAGAAGAEDAALILGIERYETRDRATRGDDVIGATQALERLGFSVTAVPNARTGNAISALDAWQADAGEAQRIVAVLTGHFVNDGVRSWLLTADAGEVSLFSVGSQAISLESVLAVLAAAPGEALLVLGEADEREGGQPPLSPGLGPLDIPQGVSVIRGDLSTVGRFVTDEMVEPRGDLIAVVEGNRRLSLSGYAPRVLRLMPNVQPEQQPEPQPQGPSEAEVALWEGAVSLDNVQAFRNYLARYPNGFFIQEAEAAIEAIISEPNRDARLAEEALGLTRPQRREIQRDLSILDYDTRGIDGIFGQGTRRAIANWQQQNGFAQTTYLTREQITRLDGQAARRAAEIEAEAERQRAEAERQDRAFWDETGARGDEPGLRAYLDRFPDGLFAQEATDRLAAIEEEKRQQARGNDRAAWDTARQVNSLEGYAAYLRDFPDGNFTAEAEARIEALSEEQSQEGQRARFRAEEESLQLNQLTRQLVEARLQDLGYEPGEMDGNFDRDSRRAIRRYQRDRQLPVTGFLNDATLVRLLADGLQTGQ